MFIKHAVLHVQKTIKIAQTEHANLSFGKRYSFIIAFLDNYEEKLVTVTSLKSTIFFNMFIHKSK